MMSKRARIAPSPEATLLSQQLATMAMQLADLPRWRYPWAEKAAAEMRVMAGMAGLLECENRRLHATVEGIIARTMSGADQERAGCPTPR